MALKSIKAIRGSACKHFNGVLEVMNENDNLAAVERLEKGKTPSEHKMGLQLP